MGYISDIRKKVGHDAIFMPAAGSAIIKDNKILLQKRADNGKWSLTGGSLELGETFIEALEREVKEELNVKLINPELVKVYSGKEMHMIYPNQDEIFGISAIYFATDYEGELHPDNDEVEKIDWFELDKLPEEINETDIKIIQDVIIYYKQKSKITV